MFWKVTCETVEGDERGTPERSGRFVLHRHRDRGGAHLDLRLECGDCLMGWRIAGDVLEDGAWATEKAPHPLRWLEQDGDAVREDAGTFAWETRDGAGRAVLLAGKHGTKRVRVEPVAQISVEAVRSIVEALAESGLEAESAAGLLADGAVARQRALARFCGLGKELDGDAFDEELWRRTLAGLSLDEIQTYLRAYEVRFDRKYPPAPVSKAERLPETAEEARDTREGTALAILKG